MIRPLKPDKKGGVFRKDREAFEEHARLLKQLRPLDSPFIEVTPNGWLFKPSAGRAGTEYIPPFHPTVTAQSSGNNKDLSIGTGWFRLPTNQPDGITKEPTLEAEIPCRRYEEFKPVIGATEIDDASGGSVPTLTLTAGKTNEIWAVWGMEAILTRIGASTLGGNTGAGAYAEQSNDGGGDSEDDPDVLIVFDWTTYVFDPDDHAITFDVHDASIATGTAGGPPAYDSQTTYAFKFGSYTLDADGVVTESEWLVKENMTPPIYPHLQSQYDSGLGDDTGENPQASTPDTT